MVQFGALAQHLHRGRARQVRLGEAEAAVLHRRGQGLPEGGLHLAQRHPVLGALRPGQARLDLGEIEAERVAEDGIGRGVGAEEVLLLAVALDQLHLGGRAAGPAQIGQRLVVHREEAAGRPVLGGHVGHGGAVGQAHLAEPGPVELHELLDHPRLAQELGDGEHEVGGGDAFPEPPGEPEADHLRCDHVQGLAEHDRLGLDAAHAPAEDAQPVDHRGVGVGPHQRVGECGPGSVLGPADHDLGQELEVDLVDDAGGGRHHAEAREGLLAPPQELVALAVAFELDLRVPPQRVGAGVDVYLHRVVDHQVHGHQGVDPPGVAPQALDRPPHGRQIHHRRHAGEVLEDHARGHEGQLDVLRRVRVPGGEVLHVGLGHQLAVQVSQDGLEEDLDGEGKAAELRGQPRLLEDRQPMDRHLALPGPQRAAGPEHVALHGAAFRSRESKPRARSVMPESTSGPGDPSLL